MDELKRDCQRLGKRTWRDGQRPRRITWDPGAEIPHSSLDSTAGHCLGERHRSVRCLPDVHGLLTRSEKVLQVGRSSTHPTPRAPVTGRHLCGRSTPQNQRPSCDRRAVNLRPQNFSRNWNSHRASLSSRTHKLTCLPS